MRITAKPIRNSGLFSYLCYIILKQHTMKTYLAIVLMISAPLIVMASEICPECIENIDLTDKQSVISCATTIIIGLLIRAFERRRLKKQLQEKEKNEKN